ncbi:hypothetical protein H8D04_00160 [bacterium]|nr:hypothetical protein [bacterium]
MSNKPSIKEVIKAEYIKCAKDPVYFLKKYAVIQHPIEGKIPFSLYDFQDKTLEDFNNYNYNIILKARQLGISTLVAGYSLWMMTFQTDKNILVIATKQDTAKNLVTKIRVMHANLPNWVKSGCTEDNKLSLKYSNGSQVKAISSGEDSGRSEALSLLILDEAAFIPKIDTIWTAAQSTLSTGGQCIALSCVTSDTYIFTGGGIKQIKDFIPKNKPIGDYRINDYNVYGNKKLRNGNLFHINGKVDTKKIITKLSEVEGSHNHKLWACKNGKYEWYRLDELSVGDWVNVQYGMDLWGNNNDVSDFNPNITNNHKNIFNPDKITCDIAYLIGMYLSEGSSQKRYRSNGDIYYSGLDFTCGDNIDFIFDKLNLTYYLAKDGMHYNVSSSTLVQFFEYIGFDLSLKAHNKVIPSRLLEMGKENISALLSGIFDGDGFSTSKHGTIGIGLSNKKLIEQIRIILLNFGIRSKYYRVSKELMNSYDYFDYGFNYDSHRLELNIRDSKLFYEKIGFKFNRKQEHKLLTENVRDGKSNDVIPFSYDLMNEFFDIYDKGNWSLTKYHGLNISNIINKQKKYKSEHISSENVHKFYNIVRSNLSDDRINEIDKFLIPNSEWVQIKEIVDGENETFDFSLPDSGDFWAHSVMYNGVLGHNTPNGVGNWFHKTWAGAEEGKNDWNFIKLHWSLHPDREQDWRDEQDKLLGPSMAAQECDCLWGESLITVRDKISGDVTDISLEELYNEV